MSVRFRLWLWAWLIAWDQLAHVGICFWTFVVRNRGHAPNPDETISSRVGRAAVRGRRWALVLEYLIDAPFAWLGQPGHCRASIEYYEQEAAHVS